MSKQNVLRYFEEFGDKMYVLAILSIVSIFTGGVVQLVMWIILFLSLKHLKNANQELNDKNLEEFRSKLIYAVIISLTGVVIVFIVGAILFFQFFQLMQGISGPTTPNLENMFLIMSLALIIAIISLVISIAGITLVMLAWKNLNIFFRNNREMFPEQIAEDAIDGSKKLKTAYLLELIAMIIGMVIIAVVFISVPILINNIGTTPNFSNILGFLIAIIASGLLAGALGIASFVLMILGYFNLAKLKDL